MHLPNGMFLRIAASISLLSFDVISDAMNPGATALTWGKRGWSGGIRQLHHKITLTVPSSTRDGHGTYRDVTASVLSSDRFREANHSCLSCGVVSLSDVSGHTYY